MRHRLLLMFMLLGLSVYAQNDYYMSNAKVSDCKGNFYDSELNQVATGDYGHNEDFIFTICVPNSDQITLTFTSFCTEKIEDYIIIYDGGDTTATKLSGKLSGSTNPGSFTSSDSCLTIYFHSDKSVACDGWTATWTTKVTPLLPPKFISPPSASCEDDKLGIRFDQKWNCDSISAANFKVTGPINPTVNTITPVNCDANNETDTFVLNVSPMLDRSGTYQVDFDAVRYDQCDSAWQLHSDTTFDITNCPILVNLIADPDTVCNGTCTEITAEVTGGDSALYQFTWSSGISGTFGPHTYCPTTSGWVKLTVADGISIPGTDSIWIEVVSPPTAGPDTTVCEAAPGFNLTSNPSGGFWYGRGIADTTVGFFNPGLAGAGTRRVTYSYAGCDAIVTINVIAFDAGLPNASCPGLSPFRVTGFNPAGGVWSGPNIDSTGLFNPSDTGQYTVTYSWNGCTDTKTINVYPITAVEFDTVCQSTDSVKLKYSPEGGVWSGPGLLSSSPGTFFPPRAGAGNKRLIYNANGCRDTTYMYVLQVDARWNQIACPDGGNLTVYQGLPTSGYWTGRGIVDSATGEYDPSFIYSINRTWYNDTLTYHANGCTDTKVLYVRQTIVYNDTLKFCIEDPRILLDWTSTRRTPGGGTWTGAGVTGNYFTPLSAGRGIHKLYYDAFGCRDSIIMVVHPRAVFQNDTTLCETDNPIQLYTAETGGYWKGNGITDTATGIFDPQVSGVGIHTIYYISKNGCLDSCAIDVDPRPVVKISGYNSSYCFHDVNYTIGATPLGGVWTGTTYGDSLFNPLVEGTGRHKLHYRFGTPTCYNEDSVYVNVRDTLFGSLTVDDDSLCFGEQANLVATGLRGSSTNYIYRWSIGSSTNRTIYTRPPSSQWVTVTITDGCSKPYVDSAYIHVFPKIEVDAAASDIQCYGTIGWAEVYPRLTDPYRLTWQTNPVQSTNRINTLVSNSYDFRVQNLFTKCILDSSVYVPSHPRINAHFITSPTPGICLNPFDPELLIINYSVGATSGTWHFGDGSTQPYTSGSNPTHRYSVDTNRYTVWLYIENDGNCKDSFSVDICVDDSVYVLVPTAFSPGKSEGLNDTYHIRTAGVTEFYFEVFNRWGERVFQTSDKNFEWDAIYKSELLPSGVYSYLIKYKGKKTIRQYSKGTIHIIR